MKSRINKIISLMLTFFILINMIPKNVYAQSNILNIDGYNVQVLENSGQREVVKLVINDETYIMTHNLFDNDYILEKQKNRNFLAKSLFSVVSSREKYKVAVKSYNENELIATVQNFNKTETFKIDETLDNIKAQASLVIGVGAAGAIGAAAAALVKAILLLCAGIVIAGVTYYTASRVIAELKKKQQGTKYYFAIRYNGNVYINAPIRSKSLAASVLKAGKDVFATASGYAYDACKSASPIGAVSKPQVHGTGTGYFLHYHPMMTRKVQGKGHCFYVR